MNKNKTTKKKKENCLSSCTSVAMHFGNLTALGAVCGITVFAALKSRLRVFPSLLDTLVNYTSQVTGLEHYIVHRTNNSGTQSFLGLTGHSYGFCGFGSDPGINTSVLIFPPSNLSWTHVYKFVLPLTPTVFQVFLGLCCSLSLSSQDYYGALFLYYPHTNNY